MPRPIKDNIRLSDNEFLQDIGKGDLFQTAEGGVWDSKQLSVLHNGIDTIKQLYTGLINQESFSKVQEFYESGSSALFQLGDYSWRVTSGRRGGYRYILKNEELGVLVLLGSFYCLPNLHGHHLKIELSPHFILSRNSDDIQIDMDRIARLFINQLGYSGVAVHLCADVQGWECPHDLDHKLTTKAKRIFKASGASSVEFESHSITTVWGRGETFTFGSVSSLQFSVYDKGKQARETGSLPFWEAVWNREGVFDMTKESRFNSDKQVRRLEARFHHTVVEQFARGMKIDFRCFYELCDHLTGLWKYALNNFRLDSSSTYVDPFWQFMRDDVVFSHDTEVLEYVRSYAKLENTSSIPSERQVKIWFGITCSMFRRMGLKFEQALKYLRNSGLYKWLIWYYPPYDFEDDTLDDSGVMDALEYKLAQ